MPASTPDELWHLLVRSRLLEPAAAAALRAEHAAAPAADAGDGSPKAIAGWLTRRGAITRWQARRLLAGGSGPFFVGDYRLLERHDRPGAALEFTARHEPSGTPVTLVLLTTDRVRDPEVWDAVVARTTAAQQTTDSAMNRGWSIVQQAGGRFLVCELAAGATLADAFRRLEPLPPREAAVLASALGLAPPAERPAATSVAVAMPIGGRSVTRPRRRPKRLGLIAGLAAGAILAAIAALVVSRLGPAPASGGAGTEQAPRAAAAERRPRPPAPEPPPATAVAGGVPAMPSPASAVADLVVDSATLPWAAPTRGPPPTLAYLPPGSRLVLLARVAEIEADGEGRLFVRSLGPAVEAALEVLVRLSGGDRTAIERVQVGWQVGDGGAAVACSVIWFTAGRAAPIDEAARSAAWGPTTPIDVDGELVHQTATLSLWSPAAEDGRALVIAPRVMVPRDDGLDATGADEPLIARIIRDTKPLAADRQAPLQATLPGDLETLVGMLDGERHVTLLGSPHDLFTSGRTILAGASTKLLDPLETVLGEEVRGAAVSLHFGERSYVELDAVAAIDVPATTLAPQVAGRLKGVAAAAEAFCDSLDADPYGRTLVRRLPAMLRALAAQLRSGGEGKGVVLNAYLPRHAPHNIILATDLALAQAFGTTVASGGGMTSGGPKGALEKLGTTMTLTFAKDNLERAIQVVSEETGVPMEILGGDLQLEGITKNQSFGLDERDKPGDEVLRAILAKSNPEGKLVYVVKEQDGVERVLITTRAAAEKRGDPLPPAYAPRK